MFYFGLSSGTASEASSVKEKSYIAPEIWITNLHKSKSDVYSWALSIRECFTGRRAFHECSDEDDLRDKKINSSYEFKFDGIENLPEINNILKINLNWNTDERDCIDDIRKFFENYLHQKSEYLTKGSSNIESTLWCFDQTNHQIYYCSNLEESNWKTVSFIPTKDLSCCFKFDDEIYFLGRNNSSEAHIDKFNIVLREWAFLTKMSYEGPLSCAGFLYENKKYLLITQKPKISKNKETHELPFQIYDVENDSLSRIQSFTWAYDFIELVNFNETVLAITWGIESSINNYYILKPEENFGWSSFRTRSNQIFMCLSAVNHKGRIFIAEGDRMEKYDPKEETWHKCSGPCRGFAYNVKLVSFADTLWAIKKSEYEGNWSFLRKYDEESDQWIDVAFDNFPNYSNEIGFF